MAKKRLGLHPYAEITDLIQNGVLGIYSAIKKFDLRRRNVKFSSYAVWWIRTAMDRGFYGHAPFISLDGMPGFNEVERRLNPLELVIHKEDTEYQREFWSSCWKRLDAQSRQLLTLRFGLTGEPKVTLATIGKTMGVSTEWVRKMELRAMEQLKEICLDYKP